ncbi:hypothetical protein [Maribacter sp. 2307ULW6-5]|uniref:hypothetical protein n=1 Tax=Maribacter sp. 2307ULW6-5 TaxID=3386275 RepID=UPI0039BCC733
MGRLLVGEVIQTFAVRKTQKVNLASFYSMGNDTTGGNLGWDYYQSMAWGGLFTINKNTGMITSETDTFKELVANSKDRQAIANIVFNEYRGSKDAYGTKCN